MPWQLDLFGPPVAVHSETVPVDEGSEAPPEPIPPRQLGFFSAAIEARRRGSAALRALDVEAAVRELASARAQGGDLEKAIAEEEALAARVRTILALPGATGLRAAIEEIDPGPALAADVRRALFLELGRRIEAAGGEVEGLGAGAAYLLGGAPDRAARALEAAVREQPQAARAWLDLGNARHALGEVRAARSAYLCAFLLDPELPVEDVVDPAIGEAALFAAELDAPGDPREWLPVAGLLLHTFAPEVTPCASDRRSARFFALLVAVERGRAAGDARIADRRALRELEPGVFARYLERIRAGAI